MPYRDNISTCVTYSVDEYMTTICNFIRSSDKHMISYKYTCIFTSSEATAPSAMESQIVE